MNEAVFLSGYVLLFASVVTGWLRYRFFDKAIRIILLLLSISLFTEMAAYLLVKMNYIFMKGVIYHIYSIVEIILITLFFLECIKPCHHKKLVVITIVVWPVSGLLNIIFFQAIDGLNTNVLMLESFSIITMSLYYIYWRLKNNAVDNIFNHPHFWIAILLLVLWSGTFFFWAFIRVLYGENWPYINSAITAHAILLLIIYCGFLLVFLLHPEKMKTIEH